MKKKSAFCVLRSKFLLMYFRSKVKLYLRVVVSFGVQEPLTLGEVHKVAVFILGNVGSFKTSKIIELLLVITSDPAGFVVRQ